MRYFNFLLSFVLLLQNCSYLKALTTAAESDSLDSTTIASNLTDTNLNTTDSDDFEVYSTSSRILNDSENVDKSLQSTSTIPIIVPFLGPIEENGKDDLRSTKDSKTVFSTADPIKETSIKNTEHAEAEETHTTEENVKSTSLPRNLLHYNVQSESQLSSSRIKRQVEAEGEVIPSGGEFSKDTLESSDQEEVIPSNSMPQSDDVNEETDDSSNSESTEEITDEPDPTEINFGNYFRSRRSASGEALEGAEFRYGLGFPYWYPRPFFGPRYLPWYSRRPWYPGYDYLRYPMFHGRK